MKGYKRCKCRADGKEVGASCPSLRRGDGSWNPSHGTWYGKVDLTPAPDGSRVTLTAGGFATQKDMADWFDAALRLLGIPEQGPDGHAPRMEILGLIKKSRQKKAALPDYDDIRRRYQEGAAFNPGSTGDWLLTWIAENRQAESWAPKYLYDVDRIVRRLFLPAFGEVPLDKLRTRHVLDMLAGIDAESERVRAAKASGDPAVRASVAGRVPTGPVSKRRYLAVLRSALSAAMAPEHRLITFNVAGIKVGKSGRKGIVKATLWTPAREAVWRQDYQARLEAAGNPGKVAAFQIWRSSPPRPGRVMVWMPEHLGRFLDHAEETGDRLANLFTVTAYCGLRRGEAVGLPLAETDLDGAALSIVTQITIVNYTPVAGEPKASSIGTVHMDPVSVAALRAERKRQVQERLAWGAAYQETGLTFTREDGSAYHPDYVSYRFERLSFDLGLPPMGIHGLRHLTAVLALANGVDIKVISAMLRHSSYQITADIYADVLPELAAKTASKVAEMVPRKKRHDAAL